MEYKYRLKKKKKKVMYCWLNSGLCLLSVLNTAVLLHDSCQCVLSVKFIAPESGSFTREEGSPSMKESADAGPKLTASQYANSLFIYLLLNDLQVQAKRLFFSVDLKKKKKTPIIPVDYLSLAHQSQGATS